MSRQPKTPKVERVPRLRASFAWVGERRFAGYVVDPAEPARRFVVELLVDGLPLKVARADEHVHALAAQQVGDGCYGFSFSVGDGTLSDARVVEARLANLGTPVGAPIALNGPARDGADPSGPGAVRWLTGLRFSGWMAEADSGTAADVLVDGELVMDVRASGWTHLGNGEDARAVRAFDFHLPERFGDGRLHRLAAVTATGEHLRGSPVTFAAFADGLERAVAALGQLESEKLRGELFDRLMPMSVPFTDYQRWCARWLAPAPAPVAMQGAVMMVGAGSMDDTLDSLHEQAHGDWVAAALPATTEVAGFDPQQARAFLDGDAAASEFIVFGLAGTLLAPAALARIAAALTKYPQAQAVYGDVDIAGEDGTVWPLAFPAFDYERMLEQGYCAHLFALRREAARRALAAGAESLYRLFNAVLDTDEAAAGSVVHLPGALGILPPFDIAVARGALAAATRAHLRQRGVEARVVPHAGSVLPAVQVSRAPGPLHPTIVIPTRNRQALLRDCIESIRPVIERRDAELIVVDNDSSEEDALDYLAAIDGDIARVLRAPGAFNFARLNNLAAEAAGGDVLCLLNNDIKALDDRWLDEMLGRLADPVVGAVGAVLLWPSGVVQHGGVVLGPSFAAAHAFNDRVARDGGYGDLLNVAHECSALTAACLVTRRDDYLDVGGMDELRFPVNFNDVDLCLKLRARGQRIVLTPHAQLLHLESASRGSDRQPDRRQRFERELQNLRAKWGEVIASDPYYSPVLSLDPVPYSALAWPLRGMASRLNEPPVAVPVPPGF